MNGSHTIARCEEVAGTTLKSVFVALSEHRVVLEQMLIKTGMMLSGAECPQQAGTATMAETTLRCLRRAVPAAVPEIVFLSGGQSADDATQRPNAICRAGDPPWKLSFSFGRALQALRSQSGKDFPATFQRRKRRFTIARNATAPPFKANILQRWKERMIETSDGTGIDQ